MLDVIISLDNWKITIPIKLYREMEGEKWVYSPKWYYYNIECTASTYDITDNKSWHILEQERYKALGMAHWLCTEGNIAKYVNPKIYEAMEACYPSFSGVLVLSPYEISPD